MQRYLIETLLIHLLKFFIDSVAIPFARQFFALNFQSHSRFAKPVKRSGTGEKSEDYPNHKVLHHTWRKSPAVV